MSKPGRRAQKTYRSQLLKGGVPYLPALEDFISQSDIAAEMPLGLQEIPLDAVVGTRTGQQDAFLLQRFSAPASG